VNCAKCLHVFFIVILVVYITATFLLWDTLTTCFQRQSVFINGYFLYIVITPLASFITELIQILITLWIIKYTNQQDLILDKSSLDDHKSSNPFYTGVSLYFFESLVFMYTAMAIALVLFIIAVLIYSLVDVFYIQPRRLRNRGLRDDEINKLPLIDVHSIT